MLQFGVVFVLCFLDKDDEAPTDISTQVFVGKLPRECSEDELRE